MSLLHSSIMGQSETLIGIDLTDKAWWEKVGNFFLSTARGISRLGYKWNYGRYK